MRVFVAGATGVLGTAAVRNLVAAGHKVTGIARSQSKRDALAAAGAAPSEADLFDPAALRHALAGHDVVVNLAEAAAAEGVLRLVQEAISFVYEDGGDAWITERHPVRPNAVTASSITATDNAMNFADAYRFAVVLRFGLIYGDEPTTRWQLDRVRKGNPVVMGDPDGYLSPITVQDAAAAVVASLAAPSGVYNVSGPPLTRADWADALGRSAGLGGPARYLSPLALRLISRRVEPLLRSQRISSDAFHNATG